MTFNCFANRVFGMKTSRNLPNLQDVVMDVNSLRYQNLKATSVFSILLHGVISLPDATSYDKRSYYMPCINFLLLCSEIILVSLRSEIFH